MAHMYHLLIAVIVTLAVRSVGAADSYTLHDDALQATFGGLPTDFGVVSELAKTGSSNVIDSTKTPGFVWKANFAGPGVGVTEVQSIDQCASQVANQASSTSVTFQWIDCQVEVPGVPKPGQNITWVEHNSSNCAGKCLPKDSTGPDGGKCDRMPGCGHDAGLPYCQLGPMKERCLNASGCTAFNTNGYLYSGTGVAPFHEYTLQCFTAQGATITALLNVTLIVSLTNGTLEHNIQFDSDGSITLWDYTVGISRLRSSHSTQAVHQTAARQLLGLYDSVAANQQGTAVYFAAHDPKHVVKSCSANTQGSMECTVMALNATLPLHTYKAAFPFALTVLDGDWWDIATRYRKWVLPNAEWVVGPLETRTDLPDWLENITMWMNNNWGGDPLGPYYGGDPEYVQNEFLKINEKLNLPGHGGVLALHWYEWDTLGYLPGSNHTKCDRTFAPCGFDTHYPNYFPARDKCKESIAAMKAAGMRVIPYINGQLYDTLIPRYKQDAALQFVQKFAAQSLRTDKTPVALSPHLEHFDKITSAVMCPATLYWQKVMRDTMLEIVNDLGFDGTYVDQVGNGEQRNCADPTHNHTIHGGSFWAEAFYKIMAEVRAGVPAKSAMFMTEGTVEEVSGKGFDILLGLQWTELPVWHAIYGGYGYATGRAGSIQKHLGFGLCAELTSQFMVGGTMGWLTYQNYKEEFFSPTHAEEVSYIQRLSQARILAKPWMVHGRVTRSILLNDSSNTLQGSCFLRETAEESSVVCAMALPARKPAASFKLNMEPSKYGLSVPAGHVVTVTDLFTGSTLGTYTSTITYGATVQPLTVQVVKLSISPSDPQMQLQS